MVIAATLRNVVVAGDRVTMNIDLRLQADAPTDPPRRSFPFEAPLDSTLSTFTKAVERRVREEVAAYQDAQTGQGRADAVVAALTGRTLTFTV